MTRVVRVEELTPAGRGGVSVLRVSGPGALDAIRRLVPRGLTSRGEPVVARLEGASDGLDEAIVCARSEDCVELHAHGSPALVEELHRALGAAPDESARAAGSVEEYALRCLASAASESGARILLDQAESALQRELQWLRNEPLGSFARGLTDLAARSHAAHFAIEPAIVVLAGPVNAGKSTLFNLLAGTRRATVCDDAGTTRDALCERAFLGRYPVELVDTAGERALEVSDPAAGVERAAQQLASEWSARAQLVLWLVPPRAAPRALVEREGPCLVLASRVDELDPSARPDGGISALADPAAARARVAEGFRLQFELPDEPWQAGRGVVLGAEARARLEQLALIPAHEARERLPELLAACRGIHPRGLPLDSARVVAEPEPVLDGATAPPAAASDSAPRQRSPGKPCAGEYSDRLPGLGDAD